MQQYIPSRPLISVLTTVKNGAAAIAGTIKSVLIQGYENIEYIIIDGGSTDETVDIIKSFTDKRIQLFVEKDKGVYFGMNNAISKAKGDVIAILNCGDSYADENVVQKIAEVYSNSVNKDIVINGGIRLVDNNGHFISNLIRDASIMRWRYFLMPVNHPAFFVSRTVYEKFGIFNTEFKIAADYEFVLRLFRKKVFFYFIPDVCTIVIPLGLSSYSNIHKHLLKEAYNVRSIFISPVFNKLIYLGTLIFLTLASVKKMILKQ